MYGSQFQFAQIQANKMILNTPKKEDFLFPKPESKSWKASMKEVIISVISYIAASEPMETRSQRGPYFSEYRGRM